MLAIFHAMVKKLIDAENVVIETKNETEYSSAVCALNRRNAVDEMTNCMEQIKTQRLFRLIEHFKSDG